jgi:hypothetical protein
MPISAVFLFRISILMNVAISQDGTSLNLNWFRLTPKTVQLTTSLHPFKSKIPKLDPNRLLPMGNNCLRTAGGGHVDLPVAHKGDRSTARGGPGVEDGVRPGRDNTPQTPCR